MNGITTKLIKTSGQSKLIQVEYNGRSVLVGLGLVNISGKGPVIQANYLINPNGETLKGWKKHGMINVLVERYLGCEIHRNRQEFIDKVYYSC
jgi:hypothetical protein